MFLYKMGQVIHIHTFVLSNLFKGDFIHTIGYNVGIAGAFQ